jgi:hypothetical protein
MASEIREEVRSSGYRTSWPAKQSCSGIILCLLLFTVLPLS